MVGGSLPIFSSILPAPNPTGKLHMGHMLNLTLQDFLCRWHSLQGYRILWPAALDHGGISTQFVVESQLKSKGVDPTCLSDAEIQEFIHDWRKSISGDILKQMKNMDLTMDFTSLGVVDDAFFGKHIEDMFAQLFKKNLVYKESAIHNWCPSCRTSLSDMEIVIKEEPVHFYVLCYQLAHLKQASINVTTRDLATITADVALAVNPGDTRYQQFIGQSVICPVTGNHIPILGEDYVDPEFSNGVARITPSVNAQDYLVAKRRGLAFSPVFDEQGKIIINSDTRLRQDVHDEYLKQLSESDNLVGEEEHLRGNAYCRYCGTQCISRESSEWYLRVSNLVKGGRQILNKRQVNIYPKRYEAVCDQWMSDMESMLSKPQKWWEGHCMAVQKSLASNSDWCISRHLKNGNRIPVYQCKSCGHHQLESEGESCAQCQSQNLSMETSVMDMWLSCALWCFAQNKQFPEITIDKAVTVTGYDLLYLWISITIMLGSVLDEGLPFKDVIIHPVIGDSQGRKMSKSLGNTLVPDDLIEHYGSNVLRLSLLMDLDINKEVIRYSEDSLKVAQTMSDDIYHTLQECMDRLEITDEPLVSEIQDHPIYSELMQYIDQYDISHFVQRLYHYVVKDLLATVTDQIEIGNSENAKSIFETTVKLISLILPGAAQLIMSSKGNADQVVNQ